MKTPFEIANKYLEWAKNLDLYADISVYTTGNIGFNCQAKSYKNVHNFVKLFKIKLEKEQSATQGCLNYRYENEKITISLYAINQLAPNCKVIYEKIVIPASKKHTIKRAKVICN
ncbi:MAG: hypothetical protein ACUZ8E_07090 [Candidatus Anammoxibacter sp.]